MIPTGLITCILIPRPVQQNQSGLPSTFPLQSHRERLWWDTGGMASHHRLREALMEAQPLKAHSNSHDWSLSSAELPGQALSKGQVIHPPLSLEFPAVHQGWDYHRHACCVSVHLLWQERSDATQPAQPVIVSVWQHGIFHKKPRRILCAHAMKAGPRFFNFLQEVEKNTKKTTMRIIKEETPLSETAIQLQIP